MTADQTFLLLRPNTPGFFSGTRVCTMSEVVQLSSICRTYWGYLFVFWGVLAWANPVMRSGMRQSKGAHASRCCLHMKNRCDFYPVPLRTTVLST